MNIKNQIMPSLFICHGSPMFVIQKSKYNNFIANLSKSIPTPTAIVVFSAHWESPVQQISSPTNHKLMYDFYGFPQELYEVQYPGKGDLGIAQEVHELLKNQGITSEFNHKRSLDHGHWSILKIMFPNADIPVIGMSLDDQLDNESLYNIGKALVPLREKGVLIIGSGSTIHSHKKMKDEEKAEFDEWIEKQLLSWNKEEMFKYHEKCPHVKTAVPSPEHFVPVLIAMGAGELEKKATLLWEEHGSTSWRFD